MVTDKYDSFRTKMTKTTLWAISVRPLTVLDNGGTKTGGGNLEIVQQKLFQILFS